MSDAHFGFQTMSPETYTDWYADEYPNLRHRSPFHHPAWLGAISSGRGIKPMHLGVFRDDRLVGALPGFTYGIGPARLYGSPLRGAMTSYLGPIGTEIPEDMSGLLALSKEASSHLRRRHRLVYTRVTLRNTPEEGKADLGEAWVQQRPGSYRLDIRGGEESVWDNLTSDCRRNIKKAIKKEVDVEPLADPDLFYEMLDNTLRRHDSTSSHSRRFFHSLFNELGSMLQPLSATHRGQIIAAGLFLRDDRELHYLSGASEPAFGSFPTSYLLHWRAIQSAIEDGLSVFNSDASRIRSIDRFKESFRPELERRHTLIGSPPLVYRAQKKLISGYRSYRQLRARLTFGG